MAQVIFPTAAEITALNIEPWHPGQVAHTSIFTGSVQVINRSYASWRGSAEIALTDNDSDARAIEAFLASLEGQGNWCELPLHRPTLATGVTTTVQAVIDHTNGIAHQIGSALTGLGVGHWLRSGDRVYLVRAMDSSKTEITLDPQIPLDIGVTLAAAATTIRVRSQEVRSQPMRRTPHWWGPWSFQWQEVV